MPRGTIGTPVDVVVGVKDGVTISEGVALTARVGLSVGGKAVFDGNTSRFGSSVVPAVSVGWGANRLGASNAGTRFVCVSTPMVVATSRDTPLSKKERRAWPAKICFWRKLAVPRLACNERSPRPIPIIAIKKKIAIPPSSK